MIIEEDRRNDSKLVKGNTRKKREQKSNKKQAVDKTREGREFRQENTRYTS